jgi:hypothetical protein
MSNTVCYPVTVLRTRSGKEALLATGRKPFFDDTVIVTMPQEDWTEGEISLFSIGRDVTDEEVEREFEVRGLKPVDPFALAAFNGVNPAFADDRPNCTHWKDKNGNWCYAAFDCSDDGRHAFVLGFEREWEAIWWFAGVRK